MSGKPYTLSELEYICKYYGHESVETIALALGRTKNAIISQVAELRRKGKFEYFQTMNHYWPEMKQKHWHPGIHKNHVGKWVVEAWKNGERVYLGCYWDLEEAKKVLGRFKETGVRPPRRIPQYISRHKDGWRVQVRENGKQIHLGYYLDFEEAKKVLEQYQLTGIKPPKKPKGGYRIASDHPWRQLEHMEFIRRQHG